MRLEQTCGSCPEQYDVWHGKVKVGYVRLRHGLFRVDCAGSRGVLEDTPEGADGEFRDQAQRVVYLTMAKQAIREWWEQNRGGLPR